MFICAIIKLKLKIKIQKGTVVCIVACRLDMILDIVIFKIMCLFRKYIPPQRLVNCS